MADAITLTLPAGEGFDDVAHLVVGGLGARLELTLEHLEDMQIALAGLLERSTAEEVTVSVLVEDGVLRTSVGPFELAQLDELERDESSFGLRRILETVCDSFELEERDGERWVQLTKRAEAVTR